jgi:hypothetical protein
VAVSGDSSHTCCLISWILIGAHYRLTNVSVTGKDVHTSATPEVQGDRIRGRCHDQRRRPQPLIMIPFQGATSFIAVISAIGMAVAPVPALHESIEDPENSGTERA